MQVQYPHEALLFTQTAQQLANFIIAFMLNILVMITFGIMPSWKIVFLPFVAMPLFFLGAAIGLVASMFSILAVDMSKVINIGLTMLMWLTPIVYSDRVTSPLVREIIRWNPLTYLVCSARDIVLFGRLYNAENYAICSVLSVVLFLVSWRLFYIAEDRIIERMA